MNRRTFIADCTRGFTAALALSPAVANQAGRPIVIDAHAHFGYLGAFGQKDVSFEQALTAADEARIDKLCVSSLEAIEFDMEQGNKALHQLLKRYPDRVIGFAVPSPHFGKKGLEEIQRAIEVYGMKGVGELVSYAYDPIDIPHWIAILERAADLKVPVLAHAAPRSLYARRPAGSGGHDSAGPPGDRLGRRTR
jgi:predicted TIM-barrel fold metal-dependent hydrolase